MKKRFAAVIAALMLLPSCSKGENNTYGRTVDLNPFFGRLVLRGEDITADIDLLEKQLKDRYAFVFAEPEEEREARMKRLGAEITEEGTDRHTGREPADRPVNTFDIYGRTSGYAVPGASAGAGYGNDYGRYIRAAKRFLTEHGITAGIDMDSAVLDDIIADEGITYYQSDEIPYCRTKSYDRSVTFNCVQDGCVIADSYVRLWLNCRYEVTMVSDRSLNYRVKQKTKLISLREAYELMLDGYGNVEFRSLSGVVIDRVSLIYLTDESNGQTPIVQPFYRFTGYSNGLYGVEGGFEATVQANKVDEHYIRQTLDP